MKTESMDFDSFKELAGSWFPGISAQAWERFKALEALYTDWNSRINVISRKDIDSLYDHHVLHSLAVAAYLLEREPEVYDSWIEGGLKVLDLGTGGGFPGIPLAILFPKVSFTLCDSVGKKTIVASAVAEALGLGNVTVVNARAETLPGPFDHIVSRAVASLSDFYPWVRGRYRGSILYLRGGDIAEETGLLMSRFRLRDVSAWPVSSWLPDSYFAGKYLVRIGR